MKKLNRKGFTLVEVTAVTIILGVLLLLAIPTISKYVGRSKKATYVSSVKALIDSVSASVNSMSLSLIPEDGEAVVIPFSEINMEKESSKEKSPYGKYINDKCYVIVVCKDDKYSYYVVAIDDKGYAIPITNENNLKEELVTDKSVSIYTLNQIKNTLNSGTIELPTFNIKCIEVDGKIIKVKLCSTAYKAGSVVQLNNGTKYYVLKNSDESKETVDLLTYYHMNVYYNYGTQSTSNKEPVITYNSPQVRDLVYEDADIYPTIQKTITEMTKDLQRTGISLEGATIKMPTLEDMGCDTTSWSCYLLRGKGIGQFWTDDIYRHDPSTPYYDEVYTFGSDGRGRATTDSRNIGLRMVITNLNKSNIDKEASKGLK